MALMIDLLRLFGRRSVGVSITKDKCLLVINCVAPPEKVSGQTTAVSIRRLLDRRPSRADSGSVAPPLENRMTTTSKPLFARYLPIAARVVLGVIFLGSGIFGMLMALGVVPMPPPK